MPPRWVESGSQTRSGLSERGHVHADSTYPTKEGATPVLRGSSDGDGGGGWLRGPSRSVGLGVGGRTRIVQLPDTAVVGGGIAGKSFDGQDIAGTCGFFFGGWTAAGLGLGLQPAVSRSFWTLTERPEVAGDRQTEASNLAAC